MILILIIFSAFIFSCNSSPLNKKQNDVDERERIFKSKCTSCHSLPVPQSKSDEEWKIILSEHNKRIKISPQNYNTILNYLQSHNQ